MNQPLMQQFFKRSLLSISLWLAAQVIWGQCQEDRLDTLSWITFEQGMPDGWQAPQTTDGGEWRLDMGSIGYYLNPGRDNWLYVNDEQLNDIGRAELLTPSWDIFPFRGHVFLEVDVLFQAFADSGWVALQVWQAGTWQQVWKTEQDVSGRLRFDLSHVQEDLLRLRWVYDDVGTWGWGFGIDNFALVGKVNTCGNDICEWGEDPTTCPGDCPVEEGPAPFWIPLGQDLAGKPVSYRQLRGGTVCDDCSEQIDLDFDFSFYGKTFRQVHLNSNGNLTFLNNYLIYTPDPFCLNGPMMIAPFFADADLAEGGKIYYYEDPGGHYLIIQWDQVGYFGCGGNCGLTNSFQAILTDGTIQEINGERLPQGVNVIFSYGDMQWTSGNSSGGEAGFGGSAATVGLNAGDAEVCHDYGTFDEDTYRYLGNYQDYACAPNGVHHLDHRSPVLDAQQGAVNPPYLPQPLELYGQQQGAGLQIFWTWEENPASITQTLQVKVKDNFESMPITPQTLGQASATGIWQYHLTDPQPEVGSNVYRLKLVQTDGTVSYTNPLYLTYSPPKEKVQILSYGPNPLQDHLNLHLTLPDTQPFMYRLTSMQAVPLLEQEEVPLAEEHVCSINLPDLPAGNYILTVYHPLGKAAVQLVKR